MKQCTAFVDKLITYTDQGRMVWQQVARPERLRRAEYNSVFVSDLKVKERIVYLAIYQQKVETYVGPTDRFTTLETVVELVRGCTANDLQFRLPAVHNRNTLWHKITYGSTVVRKIVEDFLADEEDNHVSK